jgi:pimeloyl-ACP methyl ester carboxylesterase
MLKDNILKILLITSIRRIFLFIVLLSLMSPLFGINIIKQIERQRTKKWERGGIQFMRFTDQQGDHGFYAKITDKPKMLLIHGFGAAAQLQWYDTARLLKNDYDLIIPDLLCSGASIVRNGDYSVEAQVQHLKAIIDYLGIKEKIIICGNSYGGLIAAEFTNKYPEHTEHLFLYDAPVKFYSLHYADSVAKTLGVPGIDELLMPPSPEEMKASLKVIYYKVPFIPDFIFNEMFDPSFPSTRGEQKKLLESLIEKEKEYQEREYQFTFPVSILWGQYDQLIPLSTAHSLIAHYNIPPERVHIFPDAAHAINMERPREFVKAVKKQTI